jgi:hypothetical protein
MYFVTGLPRSRTAWFSEYLPDCLHEGMNGCYSYKEYMNKLSSGDSSCGLMYFPLREFYPDAHLVIVERDIDDVAQSLQGINLFNDNVYQVLKTAQKLLNKMSGYRVDFYDLDIKGIWEYLIGTEFDRKRTEDFEMRNIQKIIPPDINAMNSFIGGDLCRG